MQSHGALYYRVDALGPGTGLSRINLGKTACWILLYILGLKRPVELPNLDIYSFNFIVHKCWFIVQSPSRCFQTKMFFTFICHCRKLMSYTMYPIQCWKEHCLRMLKNIRGYCDSHKMKLVALVFCQSDVTEYLNISFFLWRHWLIQRSDITYRDVEMLEFWNRRPYSSRKTIALVVAMWFLRGDCN